MAIQSNYVSQDMLDIFNPALLGRLILGLRMTFEGKFIQKEGGRKVMMSTVVFLMKFSCQWR